MRTYSVRPGFSSSPVVFTIIAITAAIQLLNLTNLDRWTELFDRFAMYAPLVDSGEWWRLFTVTLIHGDFLHLAFNMYALYLLGPPLEKEIGGARFISLWLATSAVASMFVYFLSERGAATVGASGSIFGLFGIWVMNAVRRRQTIAGRAMLSQLGTVLAINAVISFTIPGISWQGHLGGLLGGLLIGDLWFRSRRMKRTAVVHTVIAILVGLVATISVII